MLNMDVLLGSLVPVTITQGLPKPNHWGTGCRVIFGCMFFFFFWEGVGEGTCILYSGNYGILLCHILKSEKRKSMLSSISANIWNHFLTCS